MILYTVFLYKLNDLQIHLKSNVISPACIKLINCILFSLQNNLAWDDFEDHIRNILDEYYDNSEWVLAGWYKQTSKDSPRAIHLCTFYPRVAVQEVPMFQPMPEREFMGIEPAQPLRPEPCLVGPPPTNAPRKLYLIFIEIILFIKTINLL